MPDAVDELDRSKRPAVTLVSAWISQVARDSRIDTALLATRADLVAVIRGDPDARLSHGWRQELVGDGVARLMDGRAGPHVRRQGQPQADRRLTRRVLDPSACRPSACCGASPHVTLGRVRTVSP